jgi:hypothetical protein
VKENWSTAGKDRCWCFSSSGSAQHAQDAQEAAGLHVQPIFEEVPEKEHILQDWRWGSPVFDKKLLGCQTNLNLVDFLSAGQNGNTYRFSIHE